MPRCTTHFLWGWYLMTTMTRRWLARASFALMLAAVALLLAVAGWRSLTLVALAVIGVCAVLAGGYWFLANRGLLRWLWLGRPPPGTQPRGARRVPCGTSPEIMLSRDLSRAHRTGGRRNRRRGPRRPADARA